MYVCVRVHMCVPACYGTELICRSRTARETGFSPSAPVESGDCITVSDLEAVPHRLNQLPKTFKPTPPPKNAALIDKYTYLQHNDAIL